MTIAIAVFTIKKWEETVQHEFEGSSKLAHSSIEYEYTGDLTGSSHLQLQMFYHPNGTAEFLGLERIQGHLGDSAGSFVLQHIGVFDGMVSTANLKIVPNSGTDELAGIIGGGKLVAGHKEDFDLSLEYEFG